MARKLILRSICVIFMNALISQAEVIKHTYDFSNYSIVHTANGFDELSLQNSISESRVGEPMIPFTPVVLLLKPQHEAVNIRVSFDDPILLPQEITLSPQQPSIPFSETQRPQFQYNQEVYRSSDSYPETRYSTVTTRYMNGYAIATALVTPVQYIPTKKQVTLFKKVTVEITTILTQSSENTIQTISGDAEVIQKITSFVHNPMDITFYTPQPHSDTDYDLLLITVKDLSAEFQKLIDFYKTNKVCSKLTIIDSISASMTGKDIQEKIRNYIRQEVNKSKIKFVLLGGDVNYIASRGMFVSVVGADGNKYEDNSIPADVYYSALDGNFNANGNTKFGEKDVDSVDFLPDVAVGRIPAANTSELQIMIKKIIAYQNKPIPNKFEQPLLAGEELDANNLGGDGLDLLIGKTNKNGFETEGIPATYKIDKLYDTKTKKWTKNELVEKINQGPSALYHSGHSNWNTNMRFTLTDITDNVFSKVNGQTNNYTFVNTIGCICGAFDKSDCIGEKMIKINNFAVAFVGNSRYGWYDNNGSADGPSNRILRFFVQALHKEKIQRIGATLMYAKVKFSPFIDASGEFEPGARRWCYYTNNLLGDPAMTVWTSNDQTSLPSPELNAVIEKQLPLSMLSKNNSYVLCVTIPLHSTASVHIVDTKGRIVEKLADKNLSPGTHRIVWNTSSIAKGNYFIQVKSRSTSHSRCVTVF